MNRDIKTLLHLSRIPGFMLLPEEEDYLNKWKAEQEAVKPKVVRKKRAPKGYATLDEMGAGNTSTVVPKDSLNKAGEVDKEAEKKVVKNVVKAEAKTTGTADES